VKTNIYIGTSGWSYEHWKKVFYPEKLKKSEWFSFYTKYYNTVELNMSFYRYPFVNMLTEWKNKMPYKFKMTFKANQQITHRKRFKDVEEETRRFYNLVSNMGENTGCILFQAPPSFHFNETNFETLQLFLSHVDLSFKNAIEFRHQDWWNADVINLLKSHNVAFCTVSGLHMPSEAVVSADFGYFRFHGPDKAYASKYSNEQLYDWANRITEKVIKNGLKEIYCYFNNDFIGYAIEDARNLCQIIAGKLK
jgi:uncharacterized protein YecE (DUF72 family)